MFGARLFQADEALKTSKHRDRLLALDFVRASAVLMVIILHSASGVLYQMESVSPSVWAVHNIINSAVRVCVPLFFMISGYLLLEPGPSREGNPLAEVFRRLSKILVPLIFWSLAYQIYITYMAGGNFDFQLIIKFLKVVFQGALVYHLGFIYEIMVIYLLVPVLRPLVKEGDAPAFYFCCIWLCLSSLQFIAFTFGANNPFGEHINLGSLGFLVAGYIVRRRLDNPRLKEVVAAALCYVAAVATTAALTSHASYNSGRYVEFFHSYNTPNVSMMSFCAFVLILYVGNNVSSSNLLHVKSAIGSLSACSFGIYFVHVLFLEKINYNITGGIASSPFDAVINIALTASVCVLVCWAFVWCLRLSKFTRWIAP